MKRRELIGRSKSAVEIPVSGVVREEVGLSDWDRVRPSMGQNEIGDVGEAGDAEVFRSRVRWFWV